METTVMLFIKLVVNLITFGGLAWAFFLHLSNRQSQSYAIATGFFVFFVSMTMNFVETKHLTGIGFSHLGLWLLSYGEVVRFYDKERNIAKYLEFKSSKDLRSYNFDDFHSMELLEPVLKSGGRKIVKTADDGNAITLDVDYDEETSFIIEGKDYDFSVGMVEGYIEIEDKGSVSSLVSPGESLMYKMKNPIKINVKAPSKVKLVLIKR